MRKLGVLVSLIQFFFAAAVLAQSNRATITGSVTDSTGAVAPSVTVTATNVETGVATATVTNSDGIYVIPNLPPGKYAVEFKKDGFETVNEPNIVLESTQVAQLNSKLLVGATTQSITVNAEAPVLDKETESVGTNMSGEDCHGSSAQHLRRRPLRREFCDRYNTRLFADQQYVRGRS